MKLISDGRIFDLDKATLIATSDWWMWYGDRRRKFYQSVNGTFFVTEECDTTMPKYRHPERITNILTNSKARDLYESIINRTSGVSYNLHITNYGDLFKLIEG